LGINITLVCAASFAIVSRDVTA